MGRIHRGGVLEKAEFEAEADRLLTLAHERGVTLRLLGAVAFARRCPNHAYLRERLDGITPTSISRRTVATPTACET
jgi:hypothetical protein